MTTQITTFNEKCLFINGGAWEQTEYVDNGIPVVQVKDMQGGTVVWTKPKFLPESSYQRYSQHRLETNDLVIATVGSHPDQPNSVVGRATIIPQYAEDALLNQNAVCIRPKDSTLDKRYLGYIGQSPELQHFIAAMAKGAANQVRIAIGALKQFPFNLPSLEVQQRIADILSNYDNLIDNNNRRIALLEESIHLVYKEWFVRSRFPGYESVKVVDGIPEGWKITTLSKIAKVNEQSISKKNSPEQIQYVDISSVTTGSINTTQAIKFVDAPSRAQRVVKHGDIIWSMVRPGRKAYALVLTPPENLIVSTGFAVISTKKIPFTFLYKAVTTDSFVSHMEQVATGAAYPAVKPKDFECMTLLIPPDKMIRQFDNFVLPIFKQIYTLQSQNKSLQQARDLLLPRLMNGSIAV